VGSGRRAPTTEETRRRAPAVPGRWSRSLGDLCLCLDARVQPVLGAAPAPAGFCRPSSPLRRPGRSGGSPGCPGRGARWRPGTCAGPTGGWLP